MAPKRGENWPVSERRKTSVESCHVSGYHGFVPKVARNNWSGAIEATSLEHTQNTN